MSSFRIKDNLKTPLKKVIIEGGEMNSVDNIFQISLQYT